MSCANTVARACARSCANSVLARKGSLPSDALVWAGRALTYIGKLLTWSN